MKYVGTTLYINYVGGGIYEHGSTVIVLYVRVSVVRRYQIIIILSSVRVVVVMI